MGSEDGVGCAFEAGEEGSAEVVDGADEVGVLHQVVGEEDAEDDGTDPGTDEAFDGLFGGELDELGPAKGDSTYVGEDVVCDDERGWEDEPDHALEDIVHDEMGLYHYQVKSHMCPGELGELEAVVALLEGANEEDEAWEVILAEIGLVCQGHALTHDI